MPEHIFQLRLTEVEEQAFAYNAAVMADGQGSITSEVQADMGYATESDLFSVMVRVRFFFLAAGSEGAQPDDMGTEVAHLTAQLTFHVPDAARFLVPTDQPNHLRLLPQVAATLIGTAYSTTRGMVFSRFAHTPLRKSPLGHIDPAVVVAALPPFRIAEN